MVTSNTDMTTMLQLYLHHMINFGYTTVPQKIFFCLLVIMFWRGYLLILFT